MSSQLLETPSKHAFSLTGLVDTVWEFARESSFHVAARALAPLAEAAAISVLRNIAEGHLQIVTATATHSFPTSVDEDGSYLRAELRVLDDTFWIRLCTMGDLGFAEAYMFGEVECDDLISTFLVFLRNRERMQNLDSRLSWLFSLPQKLTASRFLNTLGNSRSNISAHYDISNQMFAGFLSMDMTYSCAIFPTLDADLTRQFTPSTSLELVETKHSILTPLPTPNNEPDSDACTDTLGDSDELYIAQMRKLDHIIRAARIRSGQRVLEIGSGWGSLAIRIASRFPDTTVDTLTLSVAQQKLAQERIKAAGPDIAKRITVHLMDYRAMPKEWAGAFDCIVSIEMVEAVGREFLEEYWSTIDWALKPQTGVGVVQSITIPEARLERYSREVDFIRKWVRRLAIGSGLSVVLLFPGGFLPSLTLLTQTLATGSKGRLVVDSVANIGPHYARTLREWQRRFVSRFDDVIEPALREEHPELGAGEKGKREVEIFRRKWIYYYCYCEVGFSTRALGDHIVTFTREGNESFGCSTFE